MIGARAHRVADFGGQNPVAPLGLDGTPDDLLGLALIIDIGGIDEIDTMIRRHADNGLGCGFIRLHAEHHGAEAQARDFETTAAQFMIAHAFPPFGYDG